MSKTGVWTVIVFGKKHSERPYMFESGRVRQIVRKDSSRRNRLGQSEECTGCGYNTFYDKATGKEQQ